MLNYIWAGLIVTSFLFALGYDARDIAGDRYRNGRPLPVALAFTEVYDSAARRVPVEIRIDPRQYAAFYETAEQPAGSYPGYLLQTREGTQLRFEAGAKLPEPLATIAKVSSSRDQELQGRLDGFSPLAAAQAPGTGLPVAAGVVFEPVRFVKLNAIAAAALDFAKTAAGIALGLVGVLALFLGLLKIAEDAGIVHALVKVVRPALRPLFPEIPADHPALGLIALNLAANVFGLGNAATPFGIKAPTRTGIRRPAPPPRRPEAAMDTVRNAINLVSYFIIPLMLVGFPLYGLYKRVPVYESFVVGAKEGFQVAVRIIPYLVAILFAVAMFRASGAMDALARLLSPILGPIGFPAEVLPMALIRPLTGSGSAALVVDMINRYGEDSIYVKMASVMFGSTETTFYVIAVYFGAVNIRKTRHAVPVGLTADISAMLFAVWSVRLLFG